MNTKEKIKTYKRYVFRYKFRQWVNDILGGFSTWKEAKEYIDVLDKKKKRKFLTIERGDLI